MAQSFEVDIIYSRNALQITSKAIKCNHCNIDIQSLNPKFRNMSIYQLLYYQEVSKIMKKFSSIVP